MTGYNTPELDAKLSRKLDSQYYGGYVVDHAAYVSLTSNTPVVSLQTKSRYLVRASPLIHPNIKVLNTIPPPSRFTVLHLTVKMVQDSQGSRFLQIHALTSRRCSGENIMHISRHN